MKLDTFLHHLHFDTEKIFPPDWQVNWDDAPLSYKLYRGLPEIPLSGELPLILNRREKLSEPDLQELGQFLWYVYGISQYAQTAFIDETSEEKAVSYSQLFRRFVPSGGALYPNEVYVYVKIDDIPEGIYHYDAAHHRLVLLREGNFDSYLSRSLGGRDVSASFCTVFITTVFWKNFYKYNHFSYRLQGLDAGVVIGQALEVADRIGFSPQVCYQFLDRPLNHLLGLQEQDESVYAVIPLSAAEGGFTPIDREEGISAGGLIREVPPLKHETYNRSKTVHDYKLLNKMNEASMFDSTGSFVEMKKESRNHLTLGSEFIMLPFAETVSYDFASVCRERRSPDMDFIMEKISQDKLAALLKETFSFPYRNDLEEGGNANRLALYGSFYNVEGVPTGVYTYDNHAHALRRISCGDYRELLQDGLTMPNLNLYQVPLVLHIVGDRHHLMEEIGYRGYRIQQMETGILLQRLLLVSSALKLGGHPLLGFRPERSDHLYGIEAEGKTSLIQIPVGPYRPRAWLKGSLSS